jgi:hypothetical protein
VPSLETVLLVAHDTRRVTVWQRGHERWECASFDAGAVIELAHLGCRLTVDDIYRDPLA